MNILPTPLTVGSIQVLIVEDEFILAFDLKEKLDNLGHKVIDIVDSAEEAIKTAIEFHPDLILMDIRLRGKMDGIEAAREIWTYLRIPIIYVTGHSDKSTVERATEIFTFGYVLKPVSEENLYVAIQTGLTNFQYKQAEFLLHKAHEELKAKFRNYATKISLLNEELQLEVPQQPQVNSEWQIKEEYICPKDKSASLLTSRQIEILRLIAEGLSTKGIAESINISPKTVEAHRVQLMKRLNIHDVVGLVRYADRHGIRTFDTGEKPVSEQDEYGTKEIP
ncbi:response regulator [Nostoc parmelioides]|uniref:Response regulator n=1 Tax=Nostoc parmelioides FACHB-3921 TaxID=2692909 RepID=A0ABR8BIJ3_9NOSO|nr:response regulator [Nostoc parmelioides]MBD2253320.1 response regulator [Nostoc parmelioides FACHB-3921]